MRVFVYEYLTALGIGSDPADPLHGMYREGQAMRDAVAGDFERLPDTQAVTLGGVGPDDEEELFRRTVRSCDRTILIAPEFDGILEQRCRWVYQNLGQLLGPREGPVSFTADKLLMAERWRRVHVRTPATTDREPTGCEAFPVVWKPQHGAGSTATFLLESTADVVRTKAVRAAERHTAPMILQQYVPGRAASVSFLCGPAGYRPLLAGAQLLTDDGRFQYLGGELPLPPDLALRAGLLATRAVGCVSGLVGFVGVDVVLGDAGDGSADHAIEINPRLTTSYVGLRELAEFNLAAAMLDAADGKPLPEFRWKPGRVRFTPSGEVTQTR